MNQGIEILVVEDSRTQALQLQYLLEEKGFIVTIAENGIKGLEEMEKHKPTLVISDIIMPEMNGYEMCKQIKERPNLKNIPVILLTTLSNPEDVIQALACSADNFVTKPYDSKFLLSRIHHILVNQEMRQDGAAGMGIEIFFAGKKHFITSDRLQIIDLLFSTYEGAVERNRELEQMHVQLTQINEKLQQEIAERKRVEAELKKASAAADAANQTKTEFLSNMSHELRSPLNSILVLAKLLTKNQTKNLEQQQLEFIQTISDAGIDLLTLIDDLLDLSKVEAGRMELHISQVILEDIRDDLERKFEPLALEKGLEFKQK